MRDPQEEPATAPWRERENEMERLRGGGEVMAWTGTRSGGSTPSLRVKRGKWITPRRGFLDRPEGHGAPEKTEYKPTGNARAPHFRSESR